MDWDVQNIQGKVFLDDLHIHGQLVNITFNPSNFFACARVYLLGGGLGHDNLNREIKIQ